MGKLNEVIVAFLKPWERVWIQCNNRSEIYIRHGSGILVGFQGPNITINKSLSAFTSSKVAIVWKG